MVGDFVLVLDWENGGCGLVGTDTVNLKIQHSSRGYFTSGDLVSGTSHTDIFDEDICTATLNIEETVSDPGGNFNVETVLRLEFDGSSNVTGSGDVDFVSSAGSCNQRFTVSGTR
jgi:hypothetical protein